MGIPNQHVRWELNSTESNDSAFYDQASAENRKHDSVKQMANIANHQIKSKADPSMTILDDSKTNDFQKELL